MDGKGLAILVLLFLITLMLFMPQRSPYTSDEPVGVAGVNIPGGNTGAAMSSQASGGAMVIQAPEDSALAGMTMSGAPFDGMTGGSFKIDQVPTDTNVGLIPKEVVTTEDFGQFSPDAILSGQNFLDPRAQIGFPETIGGNLRNANHDFRSEPINPRDPVSIFNLSTIPPDTMRPKFEIENEYKGYA